MRDMVMAAEDDPTHGRALLRLLQMTVGVEATLVANGRDVAPALRAVPDRFFLALVDRSRAMSRANGPSPHRTAAWYATADRPENGARRLGPAGVSITPQRATTVPSRTSAIAVRLVRETRVRMRASASTLAAPRSQEAPPTTAVIATTRIVSSPMPMWGMVLNRPRRDPRTSARAPRRTTAVSPSRAQRSIPGESMRGADAPYSNKHAPDGASVRRSVRTQPRCTGVIRRGDRSVASPGQKPDTPTFR